jgi:phosphoribosylaminoimidazolecarboxamide formyltransferase/IMP cyclohydrolase
MRENGVLPIRRALLSVAEKSGLSELARGLAHHGVALVSSGSTASYIRRAGLPVTTVSEVTGFPELLGGRVKTLHPRIHAGILADKRNAEHLESLREHDIDPFDLVVVNLYPFREAVASGADTAAIIEQIDIGGPALVRAAAKNFGSACVVVSPDRYASILDELSDRQGLSYETRLRLAREAFSYTAAYDAAIAGWFDGLAGGEALEEADRVWPPPRLDVGMLLRSSLRYGENPHQRAALYAASAHRGPLGNAAVLGGKEMSFNNWLDAEAARAAVAMFERPAAVIVKHHNPCGVAVAETLALAYERALESDPVSAFGGIVSFNRDVDEEAALAMADVFTEVVIAPGFDEVALAEFSRRRNLRVVRAEAPAAGAPDLRPIDGGALLQDPDRITETRDDIIVVTSVEPTPEQWTDMLFAWKVAARVKSNAIVLAMGEATVGIGAGQMNRLTSVGIAARQAGDRAKGSCLASDAFFPFRDGLDAAADAGVSAVIQPGGSVRDEEVVAAAEEHGIAMVFTGRRHFRH